jgi:hypothetical protein
VISHILFGVTVGLLLFYFGVSEHDMLLIAVLVFLFLGMPTERLLNVFLSPFFAFELNASDNSEN